MNKLFTASMLSVLLTAVGIASFQAVGNASANSEEGSRNAPPMGHNQHHRPPQLEDVTRTVTNIDNGVTITLTTDNADSLEKLQEILNDDHERPRDESVEESITLLDNGIEITLTSEDADVVERIQERSAREPGDGPMMDHPAPLEDLTRTVTNLENGVTITLTTDNADTLEKLLAGPEDGKEPQHPDTVEVTVTPLDNGVEITMTSDDADEVTRLQEHAADPRPMQHHRMHDEQSFDNEESDA